MEVFKEGSKEASPLEIMVGQVEREIYPNNLGPVWWDKLPISRFTLDKFNPLQDQRILSQELYKNRGTGAFYGRYYFHPSTTDNFIPTMVLGKPDDVTRFASRDRSDVFDLNISDGINLTPLSRPIFNDW